VDDLEAAARRYQGLKRQLDEAREHLASKIVESARSGVRQSEIVRVTGYTREHVRRLCRQAGISPDE
jgi:urease gamma subunit